MNWVDKMLNEDSEKEPWEMTLKEYINNVALKNAVGYARKANKGIGEMFHKYQVIKALKEGKKVPEKVLADYKNSKWVTELKHPLLNEGLSNKEYDRIIQIQRETEGMRAAIIDPKTKRMYTGYSHQSIINSCPHEPMGKFPELNLYGRLSREWDNMTKNVGFVNKNGEFMSRYETEKLYRISTMEDLKDIHKQKSLTRIFH